MTHFEHCATRHGGPCDCPLRLLEPLDIPTGTLTSAKGAGWPDDTHVDFTTPGFVHPDRP